MGGFLPACVCRERAAPEWVTECALHAHAYGSHFVGGVLYVGDVVIHLRTQSPSGAQILVGVRPGDVDAFRRELAGRCRC